MADAFETFVGDPSDLGDGDEIVLTLRDLTPGRHKYFAQHVRAVVTRKPESSESRPLRVRSTVGNLFPGDWYVTIIERLPQRVPGTPYENAFEALRRWGEG